jgi:hypothetical protein
MSEPGVAMPQAGHLPKKRKISAPSHTKFRFRRAVLVARHGYRPGIRSTYPLHSVVVACRGLAKGGSRRRLARHADPAARNVTKQDAAARLARTH